MKTPEEYLQDVAAALDSDAEEGRITKEFSYETSAEARILKKQLQHNKKKLRFVRKSINADLREIRADYVAKRAEVGQSAINLLFGRRGGKMRAHERRRLSAEEQRVIEPYENVKQAIDDALLQIDDYILKMDLDLATRPAEDDAKPAPKPRKDPGDDSAW